MKVYLIATGVLFALLALAHLFRTIGEWPRLGTDPWFFFGPVTGPNRSTTKGDPKKSHLGSVLIGPRSGLMPRQPAHALYGACSRRTAATICDAKRGPMLRSRSADLLWERTLLSRYTPLRRSRRF